MAPKQRKKVQVVASVVKTKTKVVEETVQVTTAEPVSGSTVQVEVETDAKKTTAVQSQEREEPNAQGRRKGGGGGGGRRRRSRRGGAGAGGGYKRYVWRVLKQVHPDMGASGRTMDVLDTMMSDMFERLAEEASRLSKVSGRATLTSREVQSAVRLVLPGDLANHAISEGTKAVSNYLS
ncbi:late histone H2B.L4-like [Oryza brachyantha]|uniref:Core Histone H2A/H2B/H3 domain-containing protein n=1 Tax=Oryza brachyantha TaxID=4533 RepID=J3N0C6_ORYBR|nr:late histone H2B.L4-like [Oryza brachyantha]